MKVLALIGLLVATVTGCEVIVGKCPDVRVVQNFEVASYLGVWYEYAKYYQVFATGSCITANYSLNTNGSVKVVNQQIEATGNISSLEGYAIFAGESDEAKLIVRFPVTPVAAPYWVLATDYTTYAVVFSCTDVVGVVSEHIDANDPVLLDKYDSFYDTTKSLLVLFQIMGVMPIERRNGGTIFRWYSPVTFWAYFIFTVETIFVSIVFKERLFLILQSGKRFDEYIYGVIFLSILIPHFMLPLGAWRNGTEVAKFKNMWTRFQLKYYRVTGTPIVFRNLTLITYSLCIVSWAVGIFVMLAQYYLQPDMQLWHTFGYFHILAMLNCLCSLWFVNCTAKGRVAGWLAENLHDALQSEDPASRLSEYRDMWVDLSHMMQQLGKAYSGMYALYCLLILLTTIVATYGCVTEILDHGLSFKELGLFLIAFYCITLLFIICNEAHSTSRKMGPAFRICLGVNQRKESIRRSGKQGVRYSEV